MAVVRTLAKTFFPSFHVPKLEGRTFRTRDEAEAWREHATPDEAFEVENVVTLDLVESPDPPTICPVSGGAVEVVLRRRDTVRSSEILPLLGLSYDGMVSLRDLINEALRAYHVPSEGPKDPKDP